MFLKLIVIEIEGVIEQSSLRMPLLAEAGKRVYYKAASSLWI